MQEQFGESLLKMVGNTPLIPIRRLNPNGKVAIYAKAEWFNPGGSVKDRPALRMVEDGEKSGQLTKDKIILDSTSGNTGIAYAMVGAIKGYQVKLVIPSNVCTERKKILHAYGTDIVYSSPFEGSDGALRLVRKIYDEDPDKYFMPGQYDNDSNWKSHYDTTGLEIINQTNGKVTHFIAGLGTSGTVMGTGRRLKDFNPNIQIWAIEPDNAFHGIEGLKHMESSIKPGIYDPSWLDGIIGVSTEESYLYAHLLAKREGYHVGHSAGAALKGALKLAAQIEEGIIVTIFPDGGDRYLSVCHQTSEDSARCTQCGRVV